MKRILLVDDDALVLRLFRDGLVRHSFQVETANDGLEAMKALRTARPDLVVLDLMMPKLTGVDVLKFIRSDPELENLPVIVLSNSYIDELAQGIQAAGVQEALLKSHCTPSTLVQVIEKLIGPGHSGEPLELEPPVPGLFAPLSSGLTTEEDVRSRACQDFLANADSHCTTLNTLFENVQSVADPVQQVRQLEAFCRKMHFVTAGAGVTGCFRIGKLTSVLEALIYVLMDKPAQLDASVVRTIQTALRLLEALFRARSDPTEESSLNPQILVVDDDPVANRLEVLALRRAQFHAYGCHDPVVALQRLQQTHYHLILLDVQMPRLDGFEFCRRARSLPRYQRIPIIYVTIHGDVQTRAEALLSGGTDVIPKPIFPMELAVKAVTHLLRSELPD